MASLGQAKSLGGVGAILVLIGGFLGAPGAILAIVGLILVLVAVKYVSEVLADQTIFNNMIIAVVLSIIGLVALVVKVLSALYSFIGFRSFSFMPGAAAPCWIGRIHHINHNRSGNSLGFFLDRFYILET
jgi:uncharacterized membrane protein